jgi:hypothetical protein
VHGLLDELAAAAAAAGAQSDVQKHLLPTHQANEGRRTTKSIHSAMLHHRLAFVGAPAHLLFI